MLTSFIKGEKPFLSQPGYHEWTVHFLWTYRQTWNTPKDFKKLVILTQARQIQQQMRNKVIDICKCQ